MRTRKEKPIFRGQTIGAVGDLTRANGSNQWTDTNITRWVTLREGRFIRLDGHAASLREEVTHVVCSKKEFERRGSLRKYLLAFTPCSRGLLIRAYVVKAALKRGKKCQIVTLDWLEDSMNKRKRLCEDPYSHRKALERERRKEKLRLEVIKGEEKGVKEVNTSMSLPSVLFWLWGGVWLILFRSLPFVSRPYFF